jgi:hypothetical protein
MQAQRLQVLLEQSSLFFGPDLQRRAFGGPDAGIFGGRLGRAKTQNNAVQYQQPD